jgi:hypothetical protein
MNTEKILLLKKTFFEFSLLSCLLSLYRFNKQGEYKASFILSLISQKEKIYCVNQRAILLISLGRAGKGSTITPSNIIFLGLLVA